jgi:hypothetical protein
MVAEIEAKEALADETIGAGATYKSLDEYNSATQKHVRTDKGPKDMQKAPLTAQQEVCLSLSPFFPALLLLPLLTSLPYFLPTSNFSTFRLDGMLIDRLRRGISLERSHVLRLFMRVN